MANKKVVWFEVLTPKQAMLFIAIGEKLRTLGFQTLYTTRKHDYINDIFETMLSSFIIINIALGIFNLIPISPLDGSKILLFFFPDKIYYKVLQYEQYSQIIILILLFTGILSRPLRIAVNYVAILFSSFCL